MLIEKVSSREEKILLISRCLLLLTASFIASRMKLTSICSHEEWVLISSLLLLDSAMKYCCSRLAVSDDHGSYNSIFPQHSEIFVAIIEIGNTIIPFWTL